MAVNKTGSFIIGTAIKQAAIIALMGLACAVAVNALRHDPLPWGGKKAESASVSALTFPVITVDEAYARYQRGTIRFIDARDPRDFEAGHLPGAVNIPAEKAREPLDALKSPALSGKELVVYCSGPDCPLSRELAEKLAAQGMKSLIIMPDGWSGWYGAGYPVEDRRGMR